MAAKIQVKDQYNNSTEVTMKDGIGFGVTEEGGNLVVFNAAGIRIAAFARDYWLEAQILEPSPILVPNRN